MLGSWRVTMLAFIEITADTLPLVHVAGVALTSWCVPVAAYPTMQAQRLEDAYTQIELPHGALRLAVAAVAWSRDQVVWYCRVRQSVLVAAENRDASRNVHRQPLRFWSAANVVSAVAYIVLVWGDPTGAKMVAT